MLANVLSYLKQHEERNLGRLRELLEIPSVSTDPYFQADVMRAATWIRDFFRSCGITSKIIDTPGHPCVLADTGPNDVSFMNLLIYGHYDVQPTGDQSAWTSPPFEPTVRNGSIFARGAADDKGQVFAHLAALEAWLKVAGGLPVRVKFLIEGEEEVGSPNLERVLRDHREELACDYAVISDSTKFDRDTPAITIAARGFVGKEIVVHGPRQNLHSGEYGGAVTNPANALAAIIASFRDDENRVTIPGFYDDICELEQSACDRLNALPFDETAFLSATGSSQLDGEHGYTTLERLWMRPTLDVNGILTGFTAEGFSAIIPSVARAKLSMRLVADQDPQIISREFDKAARAACPQGVDLEIINHGTCPPYVVPMDSPGVQTAAGVLEAGFGHKPVVVRGGGSLPVLPLIKEVLGTDTLMLGFSVPGCNMHGPNEFLVVADFHGGARSAAYLLDRFAKLERTPSVV